MGENHEKYIMGAIVIGIIVEILLFKILFFQGSCVWNSVTGRQVVLSDTSLLNLTEIERKVLQKVAIAKLQALNLGVAVKIPSGKL